MRDLLLIAISLFASNRILAQDLTRIYQKAQSAIFSIETSTSSRTESKYGSGFMISRDGILITNYHVIRDARSIIVRNAKGDQWLSVRVGPCDETNDLAALKIEGTFSNVLSVPPHPIFKVGQRVVAIGNPKGLESTLSDGIISGIRALSADQLEVIQTTAPISPGSSGGPLLNLTGEVLGATTFQLVGGQNLNFAVPVGSFAATVKTGDWLTIVEWRKELVRPEVERKLAAIQWEIHAGRTHSARALLAEVLQLDETNRDAVLALARIFVDEWNNTEALRLVSAYVAQDSTAALAFEIQGIALDRLGHSKRAISSFERALGLNDSLPATHYQLALLFWLQKDTTRARTHLRSLNTLNHELYLRASEVLQ